MLLICNVVNLQHNYLAMLQKMQIIQQTQKTETLITFN
jgi:hypothetical protein